MTSLPYATTYCAVVSFAPSLRSVSLSVERIVRTRGGVSVMVYHRVGGGTQSEVDLDASTFEQQLEHLGEHFRVITLDEAIRGLSREDHAVDNTVVLTFDDGTSDFSEVVVPMLVRHHMPATLYLATSFVDEQLAFPWGAPPLSWAGVAEAVSTSLVTIGSHTHTHRPLARVGTDAVRDELDRSIDLIGEHTGSVPMHFAYPRAIAGSAATRAMVATRFRSAALARSRVNTVGRTDLQRLWRTPVQRGDDVDSFDQIVRSGLRLEGSARSATAHWHSRGRSR